VFIVRGTKKFRDRVRAPAAIPELPASTVLGDWYATVLFWRPQVALFADEQTLLPVLVPFAPASTLLSRFPDVLGQVLTAHGVPSWFIRRELAEMGTYRLEATKNRSVVGMLTEFSYLLEHHADPDGELDLLALAARLAHTPCGPLYSRHSFPDRELHAVITTIAPDLGPH
jgi:hypothetical protein